MLQQQRGKKGGGKNALFLHFLFLRGSGRIGETYGGGGGLSESWHRERILLSPFPFRKHDLDSGEEGFLCPDKKYMGYRRKKTELEPRFTTVKYLFLLYGRCSSTVPTR